MAEKNTIESWDILHQESLFFCPIFEVWRKHARSRGSQKEHNFFVLHSPTWVNILPITAENEVVLIRQYRIGMEDFTYEIPGGLVEKQEDPQTGAARELLEETGYGQGQVSLLGQIQPNPATHNNWCFSYIMENAQKVADQQLDQNEEIEIKLTPKNKIPEMVANGLIVHSLVLNAFLYYQFRENSLGNKDPWNVH